MFNSSRPLIIGHRGSPGLFPEHTHASYSNAYVENVDFVELDLQITKDGHLVISHDAFLKATTNILDYADLYADKMCNFDLNPEYDLVCDNDYLIRNFTLVEIKTLRRNQRFAIRNQDLNGLFPMVTLEETIDLMLKL